MTKKCKCTFRWETHWCWPLRYWRFKIFQDEEGINAIMIGPMEIDWWWE
jgi:hypothetical protein